MKSIGHTLMVGIPGSILDDDTQSKLLQIRPSGIILFRRNIETPIQIRALTDALRDLLGPNIIIGVDQEGGVVTRLDEGFTPTIGAMAISATQESDNARQVAKICGTELSAVGINMNFAPTTDVNNNPNNPVIHVRAFSDKPTTVSQFASAQMKGYLESGVIPVAKHFPGHGDTNVDSHIGLARIDHDMARLEKIELRPFQDLINQGLPAIMVAHVHFSQLNPEPLPASLSSEVVTGLLKHKMGFGGAVLSDCLTMGAIVKWGDRAQAISKSLLAGVDIPMVSHDLTQTILAIEQADRTHADNRDYFDAITRAQVQIQQLHQQLGPIPNWEQAQYLIRQREHIRAQENMQIATVTQLSQTPLPSVAIKDVDWLYLDDGGRISDAEDKHNYFAWFSQQCQQLGIKLLDQESDIPSANTKLCQGIVVSPHATTLSGKVPSNVLHVLTRIPSQLNASGANTIWALFEESVAAQKALWETLFFQLTPTGKCPIELV
ncbi:beta-N-acetylhexosaminidase [Vibrio sp. DW001]|uniref:beta-N-acetylhexosaminidase n=1 Tax=Vibrio sp. DW001 TaxID=2912315 RepID=UPI0023B06CAF|nr:beta-N-acetylhexosaminidase [Vibrio sp. DW001]WED27830.1 beta-N-acetylhexosaminidase [Vibrio sp. DW001]